MRTPEEWSDAYYASRKICMPLETNQDFAKLAAFAQRDGQYGHRRRMSQPEYLQWWLERDRNKEQLRLSMGAVTYQVDFSPQES
jgi:hypothetical protein